MDGLAYATPVDDRLTAEAGHLQLRIVGKDGPEVVAEGQLDHQHRGLLPAAQPRLGELEFQEERGAHSAADRDEAPDPAFQAELLLELLDRVPASSMLGVGDL